MSGSWEGSLNPAIIEMTALSTRFGNVFLMRFLGLGALWFACALRVRSQGLAISLLAGLLLASLGPISHAAAGSSDTLSIGAISDAAHLLTAGFWLGGLVVLAMFLRRNREDQASLLGALRLFSTWGSLAVAMLVITGSISAISILPVQDMSLDNAYFDLLLVKVGLASVMIGLAALNRWHFVPALRTDGERAIQHLLASVVGEIGLAIGIVSIVGLLGLMAPH
jgi:putative copper resistance protein D